MFFNFISPLCKNAFSYIKYKITVNYEDDEVVL